MAVDPTISMQTRQADVATPINQAAQLDQQNALTAEQTLKSHYENMAERDKQRLQSTIVGASQLKPYLDKGDLEGAHEFLVKRREALHSRMGAGENVDTQETDYALEKIRSGDIEGLQNDVASMLAAGQAYGMIGSNNTPASVKEWQFYNSLDENKKKEWLNNKRAGSNVDLGDRTLRLGADGQPETTYVKGITPDNQPKNVEDKAAAQVLGTERGVSEAKKKDIEAAIPSLMQVVDKLSNLGKTATYSKTGVISDNIARELGAVTGDKTVPQGAVDRTEYISTVDNEVLPLLRQTFGAQFTLEEGKSLRATLGDPDKSPQEKDAVLRAFIEAKIREVSTLERRIDQPQNPASAQGGKIKVSNGQETFTIDAADLPAAQAEGFKQVQ